MGHLAAKSVYQNLQQRLDRMPVGAPEHKAFYEILKLLFTEEEAFIASRMPIRFSSLKTIQKRTGKNIRYLKEKLDGMAEKGLVIDLQRGRDRAYYVLLPTVIGFFEFSMMRVRNDYDQKVLSNFYEEYMLRDPENVFLKQAISGDTPLIRTLVHEDALDPQLYAEVLDYEKATWVIKSAKQHAVALCHCRHVKEHVGEACEHPLRMCLTFGNGTEYFVRHKLAEPIEQTEALDILAMAREMNMVQTADNVKNNIGFICNCCGCGCTILESYKRFRPMHKPMYSSNFISTISDEDCTGCGKCAKACPIDCITMETTQQAKPKMRARIDETRCIGCGVCVRACSSAAIRMEKRSQRLFTPEHSLERILIMALERGKFQHLLFDDLESIPILFINQIMGWILKRKPVQTLLLKENIRSKWIEFVLNYANKGG
ncbi:4Fe-4S dicluster domain-containing protein [candidate division KSB1 bacterium]|nr:4Fe-4S dicluster domain-containing protein [candidate division KSB1 bacterium]